MSITRTGKLLRPWLLITVFCLIYSLAVVAKNGGDSLALVSIGTQFSEGIPESAGGTEGYDGQFVYYIARDPSTAAPFLDVPAYRFQRILLPMLGRALALGHTTLLPWALLAVNLAALGAGTALMEYLLRQRHASRWYAVGYGLTMGAFGAARLILPETLAYAFVLGGIALAGQKRWLWSAVLFALAAVTKETTLVFAAGYGLYLLVQRRWAAALLFCGTAGLPFIIWQLILFDRLGAFGIGSGGALATSFELIPFVGVIRILTEGGLAIFAILGLILAPFVILPTIWGLWRSWRDYVQRRWTLDTVLLFVNTGVMLFVPFSTYREPLGILRFIIGLQIAVILYAAERHSSRALRNSTIWFTTLIFLIGSDFGGG